MLNMRMIKIISLFFFMSILLQSYAISIENFEKDNGFDIFQFNIKNNFVQGNILYVGGNGPNNYSNIQDAIDSSSDYDTIFIYKKTYNENIIINKKIRLIGENRELTIIDGSGSDNIIKVDSDDVLISSFTIQNGAIGVYIVQSSNVTIDCNDIIDNWEGIGLLRSSNCLIFNNLVYSNLFEGINPVKSDYIEITGNRIESNIQGIFLSNTNDSIINRNIIKSNTRGVEIRSNSDRNLIYNNDFFNNQEDNAFDECNNNWDNDYPIGGNYWHDYEGEDVNSDGIGDTSYDIPGGSNEDRYPYMVQKGWNNPPVKPFDPFPEPNAENISTNITLRWNCSDLDDDPLTYDVYIGTLSSPTQVSWGQTDNFYTPEILENNTLYYWKIVAWDSLGASNKSSIWRFTTQTGGNQAPYTPNSPFPENESSNIPINIMLSWEGGDPDINDTISYDIYFGINPLTEPIALNHTETQINPGTLSYNTTYYWKVIAKDNYYHSTEGPIWEFKTIESNLPPEIPIINGSLTGKPGVEYEYTFISYDPEGDNIYYIISWGDNNEIEIGPFLSGENVTISHIWDEQGTYRIKAKAKDVINEESDWATLEISIAKTRIFNFKQILINFLKLSNFLLHFF